MANKKRKDIMKFAGAWKDIDKEEIEDMKRAIEEHDLKETKELLKKYKK